MILENNPEKVLKEISGGRVLDVAAGAGNSLKYLKETLKEYKELVGVDIIPVDRVKEISGGFFDEPGIEYFEMDSKNLSFEDNSFNTVSIVNSLHHMDDVEKVLLEMKRVLAPGGHAIISEMYSDGQDEHEMAHVLLHHWWAKIDGGLGIPHFETFPRKKLESLIEKLAVKPIRYFENRDESDPFDQDRIKGVEDIIDRYIKKAEPLNDYEALKKEGESLLIRIKDKGVKWCKGLTAVCG